jgi:hypothetical protein
MAVDGVRHDHLVVEGGQSDLLLLQGIHLMVDAPDARDVSVLFFVRLQDSLIVLVIESLS